MNAIRVRREAPPFRPVEVTRVERRSPYLTRVTLTGSALHGFDAGLPAGSVRLLLPDDRGVVVLPTWRGNEFLYDDETRPTIRTLTPLRFDSASLELDVEIVHHGGGPLSELAQEAERGDRLAVSGTGRGYEIDPGGRSYLLAGDESALPAIGVLLAALPSDASVRVLLEVRHRSARVELPAHRSVTVDWIEAEPDAPPGASLVAALVGEPLDPDVRIWAAGEAASMQRIRTHLFDDHGLSRSQAVVRGYWKDRDPR